MSYNTGDNFVTIDAWGGSGKHQCLWHIAKDSSLPGYKSDINARVAELKKINNITNEKYVYTGTKIYLSTNSTTTTSGSTSNAPIIKSYGIQKGTDRTVFVTWEWYNHKETEKYEYEWYYDTGDKDNGLEWYFGDSGDTGTRTQVTFTPDAKAKRVRFRVRPIAIKEG